MDNKILVNSKIQLTHILLILTDYSKQKITTGRA